MSNYNYYRAFLLLIPLFTFIECDVGQFRDRGRLFGNSYTTTITESKVVTSLVPSSCVRVEPTLPPCRNVRYLKFPKLPAITFYHPASEEVITNWKTEPKISTTPLGWGEYLGLYAPTVTETTTNFHVTTVQDPSVVVTFAVKGCRPMRLPLDLDRCPQEFSSSVTIEETLQTSTVASPVVATESLLVTKTMTAVNPTRSPYESLQNLPKVREIPDNANLLEPSAQEIRENGPSQPTETLSVQPAA